MPGFPVLHCLLELLKFMSIELMMPSNHFILCCPLLLPPSIFPSIRVFSNESALRIRWPKYWSFSFSISPSNDWSKIICSRKNEMYMTINESNCSLPAIQGAYKCGLLGYFLALLCSGCVTHCQRGWMASLERTRKASGSGSCRLPGQHSPDGDWAGLGGIALEMAGLHPPQQNPERVWPGIYHLGYSHIF